MDDIIQEIKGAKIRSFAEAIDFKYDTQNKLVSLWFSHKITTQDFMYLLTLMYERIMDELISNYFSSDICVIGFGKIGAYEINFSSDIDVCFVFRSGADEEKVIKEVRNFVLESIRKRGSKFIWRLDLDLRPGGRASPIAVSDSFFSWYYLNLGRIDDRYTLLRARPIAGDKQMGERIINEISPFVFRRYLDFSVIERLKEIKVLISRHLKSSQDEFDVKYSPGGIRELEFVAFANQMIFGGRDERFRAKRTTEILDIIDKEQRVASSGMNLKDCYIFLREIESIVQLDEEYRFNITEKDIPRILEFYGTTYDTFLQRLGNTRKTVSEVFRETFEVDEPEYRIMTDDLSDEDIKRYLDSLGYKDLNSTLNIFKSMMRRTSFLKERQRVYMYDSDISETVSAERLVSSIIWHCSKVKNSDVVLSHMSSFISAVGKRRGVYVMLFKNERIIKILAELMSNSVFFSNFLVKHPESIDTIFLSRKREVLPENEDLFWQRVRGLAVDLVLDEIRKEKKEKILITVMDDISQRLDIFDISKRITKIYDFVLRETISLTSREKLNLDLPPSLLNIPFVVIATGKYGSEEAIYGSDADIMFSFYDEDSIEKWIKFSQRLLNFITAKTKEGEGLQVDMRLRPSGRAGPLATSKRAMSSFYLETENVWELFPLLKSRVVFDGYGMFSDFLVELRERAFQRFDLKRIKDEMLKIRERSRAHLGIKKQNDVNMFNLKYCDGGLYDFELIVLFNQIETRSFNITFLEAVERAADRFGEQLREAYKLLRRIEKFVKLKSDVSLDEIWIPEDPESEFWHDIADVEKITYDDFRNATEVIGEFFRYLLK